MSWDLDYARAWNELYWPAYKCLPRGIRSLFHRVAHECCDLYQDSYTNMIWPGTDSHHEHGYDLPLKAAFQQCDMGNLLWASHVIYFLGHFFPYSGEPLAERVLFFEEADHVSSGFFDIVRGKQFGGATWKFSNYADTVLTKNLMRPLPSSGRWSPVYEYYVDKGWLMLRHNHEGWTNYQVGFATVSQLERTKDMVATTHLDNLSDAVEQLRMQAMEGMDDWQRDAFELKPKFYTHREGTELDDEEIEWQYRSLLDGTFIVRGIRHVNFKPHPFVTGPKHLANSQGPTLDPDCAPCAYREEGKVYSVCQLSYVEHTSKKALLLEPARTVTTAEAQQILARLPTERDGIDGIGFVDSDKGYTITPSPAP